MGKMAVSEIPTFFTLFFAIAQIASNRLKEAETLRENTSELCRNLELE
jgi:hypothetical protein